MSGLSTNAISASNLKSVAQEVKRVMETKIPKVLSDEQQRLISGASNDLGRATAHGLTGIAGLIALLNSQKAVPLEWVNALKSGLSERIKSLGQSLNLADSPMAKGHLLRTANQTKTFTKGPFNDLHTRAVDALTGMDQAHDKLAALKPVGDKIDAIANGMGAHDHLAYVHHHPVLAATVAGLVGLTGFFGTRGFWRMEKFNKLLGRNLLA